MVYVTLTYFQLSLPTSTTPFWFKQWFPWSSGTRTGGLCTMHYALCTMRYALCYMHYALCTMHVDYEEYSQT